MKLAQTIGPTLGGKKPKGRKNSTMNPEEKEFRIMIVKMIKNLENKMKKMQESINKT